MAAGKFEQFTTLRSLTTKVNADYPKTNEFIRFVKQIKGKKILLGNGLPYKHKALGLVDVDDEANVSDFLNRVSAFLFVLILFVMKKPAI